MPVLAPKVDTIRLHEVSFVDDMAFPIFAADSALPGLVADPAAIVFATMAEHQLKMNLKAGKSEVILALRGHCTNQVRKQVFIVYDGKISFWPRRVVPCFAA